MRAHRFFRKTSKFPSCNGLISSHFGKTRSTVPSRLFSDSDSKDPIDEDSLTYSQEYYYINRDEINKKKKEKRQMAAMQGSQELGPGVLKRPEKGTLWGVDGSKFEYNPKSLDEEEKYSVEMLADFLSHELVKDLTEVDLPEGKFTHLERKALLGTCFSARHLYKVTKTLERELKKFHEELGDEELPGPYRAGGRHDSWHIVTYNGIGVHLMLDYVRDDLNFEERWFVDVPEEDLEEHRQMTELARTRHKGFGSLTKFEEYD
eukprot:CAMPEP_0115028634 /NCGR_PEP_ID=MMETSP0216-20121206/36447_1 /TAXON_ID=223996 /ORGANISM="Protocruzia adherens, Strain Boccale" /LENGTH=261 /DNA_ID=CAMNT_0002404915 /DNA_START=30 /DNA_END=815 /DNA_ORIENTATION=-